MSHNFKKNEKNKCRHKYVVISIAVISIVAIFLILKSQITFMSKYANTFDPKFSSKLYSFAKKQWEERIENFDERLQSVYDRYNPKDIIKFAVMKNNAEVKL